MVKHLPLAYSTAQTWLVRLNAQAINLIRECALWLQRYKGEAHADGYPPRARWPSKHVESLLKQVYFIFVGDSCFNSCGGLSHRGYQTS
jgi:hypothetical protein